MAVCLCCNSAFAQRDGSKTFTTNKLVGIEENLNQTESYRLSAGYEMLVTPLVATIQVKSMNNDGKTFKRADFTGSARKNIPAGLSKNEYLISIHNGKNAGDYNRDFDMLKAQVIYDFCSETGADVIVAPQFSITQKTKIVKTTDVDGNSVEIAQPVEMNGKYVMQVEVFGYPATYTGFRAGTSGDAWIKSLFKMGQISDVDANFNTTEIQTNK